MELLLHGFNLIDIDNIYAYIYKKNLKRMKKYNMKNNDSNLIKRIFDQAIVRSWWVFLFLLCGYFALNFIINRKEEDIQKLEARLNGLHDQRIYAENQKEDYLLRINSHSDPAWIELVLQKELGVVPEGHIKVHFTNE
jgi:hypothetical protein